MHGAKRTQRDLGEPRVTQARPERVKEWPWTQGFREGLEMHLESLLGMSGVLSWLSSVVRCEAAGVVWVVSELCLESWGV